MNYNINLIYYCFKCINKIVEKSEHNTTNYFLKEEFFDIYNNFVSNYINNSIILNLFLDFLILCNNNSVIYQTLLISKKYYSIFQKILSIKSYDNSYFLFKFLSSFKLIQYNEVNINFQKLLFYKCEEYLNYIELDNNLNKENEEKTINFLLTLKNISLTSESSIISLFLNLDRNLNMFIESLINIKEFNNNNLIINILILIIGNLLADEDSNNINKFIDIGLLDYLQNKLNDSNINNDLKLRIIWALSNIVVDKQYFDYLKGKNIFLNLIDFYKNLNNPSIEIVKEIINFFNCCFQYYDFIQILTFLDYNIIKFYINFLNEWKEPEIILLCLYGFQELFQKGNLYNTNLNYDINPFLLNFNNYGGKDLLNNILFKSKNSRIISSCENILNKFFNSKE